MLRYCLAICLLLTMLIGTTRATFFGEVLAVTPTSVTIKGETRTETYEFGNELLTNTVADDPYGGWRGTIADLKEGCKIVIQSEERGGMEVCTHINIQH